MRGLGRVLEKVFRLAGGAQCEVLAERRARALTRFAGNAVSQNVASVSTIYSLRLLDDGRAAGASFNQAGGGAPERAVRAALETLRSLKKDPALLPLPRPKALPAGKNLFFRETAGLGPLWRAGRAAGLAKACLRAGQSACGAVENGETELVVASNRGVFARHRYSFASYDVTVQDGDGFGWAGRHAHDAADLPFALLDETARAKAAAGRRPRAAAPGRYSVVLEPQAAADLLAELCAYGFGGQFYADGRSFASGRLGERALSPLLTIGDDFLGPAPGRPFDFEGQPRARLTLVENGVLKAVVHDRRTAKDCGGTSTGHAGPPYSRLGPQPLNLAVKPGRGRLADLIGGVERGILVTQFHYTGLLKARTVETTGMTRNGTFLIEDGRVKRPVKNLRFTQSLAEAFAAVSAVGGEAVPVLGRTPMSCPALRLDGFNFTSATDF